MEQTTLYQFEKKTIELNQAQYVLANTHLDEPSLALIKLDDVDVQFLDSVWLTYEDEWKLRVTIIEKFRVTVEQAFRLIQEKDAAFLPTDFQQTIEQLNKFNESFIGPNTTVTLVTYTVGAIFD